MDATQNELLATLTNFFSVEVLLEDLVVILDLLDALTEVAKEIIQEEVESLQEVSIVLDWATNAHVSHPLFDKASISVL